jgi:hypothetical protein
MRPWATRTAKTALLAAGFAAAVGGLSGVALAAGSNVSSGASPGLSRGQLVAPAGVCDEPGALMGVVGAACQVGTAVLPPTAPAQTGRDTTGSSPAGSGTGRPACGSAAGPAFAGGAAGVIQRTVAPVTSVLGVNAPAGTGSFSSGPLAGLQQTSGLAPLATAPAPGGLAGGSTSSIFGNTPGAGGAGDTNVPAASQLAGLGALPGLADLPSLAGLANTPAPIGVSGGGIPMPGTALSAANTSGMSSDSFAALAVGALLAGASALKIAGRRVRDRKAGFGVAI